jgi:F0F1-type ATP synthase assembly protein I
MVMDMTWQLAIVVLVPIVGGFYLDRYFHTSPGLLIAGIVLAAFGVVSVMIRIVGKANRRIGGKK